MKLQTIYQNRFSTVCSSVYSSRRGFLTIEIMLAFSLFTLLTISTFTLSFSMQTLRQWSIKELEKMESLVMSFDEGIFDNSYDYGNETKVLENSLFRISKSDYKRAWGRNSCNPRIDFNNKTLKYYSDGIDIGLSNPSTDLEVRNDYVYLTADSSTSQSPDFLILNIKNPQNISIVSLLNTGPGLSAIEVAGPYAFVAKSSTISQLQIIDIHDRSKPQTVSELKLPLPTSSTTAPFATSIFYSEGFIYLGTAKWNGPEFSIIDVSNIYAPLVIGQFETNTLINDIYVVDERVFLASSDEKQLRVLDISDKSHPTLIDSFSPTGWQTQEGRIIEYFEGMVGLGRTVGGFNVVTNFESYIFPISGSTSPINFLTNYHRDIPGGVYGMLIRSNFNILISQALNKELQVFDKNLNTKLFEIPLGFAPIRMSCDGSNIIFATGNSKGISILKLNE
jgi:hypothetical protein